MQRFKCSTLLCCSWLLLLLMLNFASAEVEKFHVEIALITSTSEGYGSTENIDYQTEPIGFSTEPDADSSTTTTTTTTTTERPKPPKPHRLWEIIIVLVILIIVISLVILVYKLKNSRSYDV